MLMTRALRRDGYAQCAASSGSHRVLPTGQSAVVRLSGDTTISRVSPATRDLGPAYQAALDMRKAAQ